MPSSLHYLTAARHCEMAELKLLLRTSALVRQLAVLVHGLQKERGLSNMVLASGGRQGWPALQAQQPVCDAALAGLDAVLAALDMAALQGGHGARLLNHLAYALQGLDALPGLRRCVTELALDADACTAAYMRLVAGLLAVVFEAADSASQPGISRLLVAIYHCMQGKELAGQERATGAAAFAAGLCSAARQQHWLHLIESQERCLQVFADSAPEALRTAWQAAEGQRPLQATLERLRRIACTATAGSPLDQGLGDRWFEACSARMDGLHTLEMQLADALEQRCRTLLQSTERLLQAPTTALPPLPLPCTPCLPAFFSTPELPLPAHTLLATGLAPQLEQSVLALVQEQAQRLQTMHTELTHARSALTERKTLERAKHLLMAHHQLSESEAHKLLRQTAMNQSRRLADVAEAVLTLAELLPHVPAPQDPQRHRDQGVEGVSAFSAASK
jgi:hypothetical protein